jgi:heme oxygenase
MTKPCSLLVRLRVGTRDAHARIETVPALVRLVAHDLTKGEYIVLLQHLQALHTHFEPAIAAELEAFPDAAALLDGKRPRRLNQDLAWFGAPTLPPPRLPELSGPIAALGALYVIEGSGLGGRVIGKHLSDCLGVAPGEGGSFFCGLDAETARQRWSRLTAILDSVDTYEHVHGSDGTTGDSVVASAEATFGSLEQCFREIATSADTGHVLAAAVAQ